MSKSPDAFRTIGEVAELLDVPAHVLRFWESRFTQIRPVKRAGGRRYYRPTDVALLGGIRKLLHDQGMTIRGVQKLLRDEGVRHVCALAAQDLVGDAVAEWEEDAAAVATFPPTVPVAPPVRVIAWPGPRDAAVADVGAAGQASPDAGEALAESAAPPTGVTEAVDPDVVTDRVIAAAEPVSVAESAETARSAGAEPIRSATADPAAAEAPTPPTVASLDDLPLFGGLRDPAPAPSAVAESGSEDPPQVPTLAPRVLAARLLLAPVGSIPPDLGRPVLDGLRALRRRMAVGHARPAG